MRCGAKRMRVSSNGAAAAAGRRRVAEDAGSCRASTQHVAQVVDLQWTPQSSARCRLNRILITSLSAYASRRVDFAQPPPRPPHRPRPVRGPLHGGTRTLEHPFLGVEHRAECLSAPHGT